MDIQDDFIKASIEERKRLTQLFNQRGINLYEFTDETSKDRHDAQITASTGTVMMIEAKCRDNDSSGYGYSTIIEHSKIEYLLSQTKNTKIKPVVTFFFNDGYVYIVELDHEMYYNWTWIENNKTTKGDNEKVWKKQVIFNIDKKKLLKLKL